MKKIIFLIATFLPVSILADDQNQPIKFEKVYEVAGLSKDQIYDGARQWFAISFKSANAVIQYEDKAAGTIIGKGNMSFPCTSYLNCLANKDIKVDFTTRVDSKDGKMRVSYDDLRKVSLPKVSSGLKLSGYSLPIQASSYDGELVSKKLDELSDEMVQKIQSQKKVNDDW